MRTRPIDLAFGAALTLLGAAHFLLVYRPSVRRADSLAAEIQSINAEICRSEDFTRGLEDLERYLSDFEESLAALDRLVPEKFDSDERIRDVDRLARTLGLRTRSIRPDPPRREGSVTLHPMSLAVAGSFADVLRFVQAAESLPQLTRATSITIEPERGGRALEAKLELTSFSLAPPEERIE